MSLSPRIALGSQYYINSGESPEHVRAGIASMREAGLRLVRVFLQWGQLESQPGVWDWSAYDALFDAAATHDVQVVATLMAVHPPGWMRLTSGSQDLGPLESAPYWGLAQDYVRRIVARYGSHPALHSWILWNEPSRDPPRDESTLAAFRAYLRGRYDDDLAAYNARVYQQLESFDQVGFPRVASPFSGYVERLDWMRFSIYMVDRYLQDIQSWVRDGDPTHPIHTNPHNLAADMSLRGQSIWAQAQFVDFLGCSAHPSWHSTRFPEDRLAQSVAFFADLMRGATPAPDRYFWVTELQGGTNIYSGLTYLCPSPDDLRVWLWEAIGCGASAVVFWCFNTRSDGFEAGEWGLLDQQGRHSRRLEAVSDVAAVLDRHAALFATSSPARSRVALLYSEATWRLGHLEGKGSDPEDPRNVEMGADACVGVYLACRDLGIAVDFLDERAVQQGRATAYSTLILPGCTALEDPTIPALTAFVEAGGTLIADGLCGYKTDDGAVRNGETSGLNALFGASVADIEALPASRALTLEGLELPAWFLKITLKPHDAARVAATFPDGAPAATVTHSGAGRAIRMGTVLFQRYFRSPSVQARTALQRWLPSVPERIQLSNPSATLRLSLLTCPDGDLLVLVNTGRAIDAAITLSEPARLFELTAEGRIAMPGDGGDGYRLALPDNTVHVFYAERLLAHSAG